MSTYSRSQRSNPGLNSWDFDIPATLIKMIVKIRIVVIPSGGGDDLAVPPRARSFFHLSISHDARRTHIVLLGFCAVLALSPRNPRFWVRNTPPMKTALSGSMTW